MSEQISTSYVGFDTETFRIGAKAVAPKLVCASFAVKDFQTDLYNATVIGNGDGDLLAKSIDAMLDDESVTIVIHNASFDLGVLVADKLERLPVIFKRLESGTIKCTQIREKLIHLTTSGDLNFIKLPNGASMKLETNLAALIRKAKGYDRAADKKATDSFRTNFSVFDNVPSETWPHEARKYSIDDSTDALDIYEWQESRRQSIIAERGFDPFQTESLRVAADFCLQLYTIRGMKVDPVEITRFIEAVKSEVTPDKINLLIEHGIVRPAEAAREYKNKACNADGTPKMTSAMKESVSESSLRKYMEQAKIDHPEIRFTYTPKSDKFPSGQISLAGEFFDKYADIDPVFAQMAHRESVSKLVETEIPRLYNKDADGKPIEGSIADVIHFPYDILKETGRTSSRASKLFPSANGQNIDPRARNCYVARDGMILGSVDYSGMELGTLAQTCFTLFGYSVMRDKINAGVDTHAFLAAQIAFKTNEGFRALCISEGLSATDKDKIFDRFFACKKPEMSLPDESKEALINFYEHYRKFAKPTNLGYPGGLGPDTFIEYSRKTFGITVDKETAVELRTTWRETYPEMVDYFKYINKDCIDPYNVGWNKDTVDEYGNVTKGESYELYQYDTPLGLHRSGCDYCAAANGKGLQSPSAEGALLGIFLVTRACYDPTQSSILYGNTFPLDFIHDENLVETIDDSGASDRIKEVGRLMVEGMKIVTPDVDARYEAVLMRRWDKRAKSVYDSAGNLTVWEPKASQPEG